MPFLTQRQQLGNDDSQQILEICRIHFSALSQLQGTGEISKSWFYDCLLGGCGPRIDGCSLSCVCKTWLCVLPAGHSRFTEYCCFYLNSCIFFGAGGCRAGGGTMRPKADKMRGRGRVGPPPRKVGAVRNPTVPKQYCHTDLEIVQITMKA